MLLWKVSLTRNCLDSIREGIQDEKVIAYSNINSGSIVTRIKVLSGLAFLMLKKRLQIFPKLGILTHETTCLEDSKIPKVLLKRSTPGILIFNTRNELLYINAEAREVLTSISADEDGFVRDRASVHSIPQAVFNLCNQLKQRVSSSKLETLNNGDVKTPSFLDVLARGVDKYSFRGFFLSNNPSGTDEEAYMLVLVERVSPAKKLNTHKAAKAFGLTKREVEVLDLVIQGLKNREIAERLYVCVYTIQDHLKKIMKKMRVGNRTSIIAKLLDA